MNGACSTRGRDEKSYKIYVGKRKIDNSEDLVADGKIILQIILRKDGRNL
jgi:hypothetical protein